MKHDLGNLDERIAAILADHVDQELPDPSYRLAILTGQVGQMARILYHDMKLYPVLCLNLLEPGGIRDTEVGFRDRQVRDQFRGQRPEQNRSDLAAGWRDQTLGAPL